MTSHSPEALKAIEGFKAWYEAKPEAVQLLIDEISDGTSFIIDEDEYDCFISELAKWGIDSATKFKESFYYEFEGTGDEVKAKFSETLTKETFGEYAADTDWLDEWKSKWCNEYKDLEFKGNTYFIYRRGPEYGW